MEKSPAHPQRDAASRFRGSVLGSAIADALAFPNLHYSRRFLASFAQQLTVEYVRPPTGCHPAGQYGPATQTMLAVLCSVVDAQGVTVEAMAGRLIPLWRDNLLVEREPSTTEAMEALVMGQREPGSSGLAIGRAEAAALPRVLAVALWDHDDPEKLAMDAGTCTHVTHTDPRCAACAAAFAAAVASNLQTEEFLLGPFLDRVAAAAGRFDEVIRDHLLDFPHTLCQNEVRALRHLASLCPDSRYPPSEDGLGEYCVPALFHAIYYFLRSPYSYENTVESCLRLGGEMGIPAFLAGAISGAFLGDDALPESLVDGLLGSREIASFARELHQTREVT